MEPIWFIPTLPLSYLFLEVWVSWFGNFLPYFGVLVPVREFLSFWGSVWVTTSSPPFGGRPDAVGSRLLGPPFCGALPAVHSFFSPRGGVLPREMGRSPKGWLRSTSLCKGEIACFEGDT